MRRHRRVAYTVDCHSAVATGHGPFPDQVDGDFLGETEHLELHHEPDVLDLLVPAGAGH